MSGYLKLLAQVRQQIAQVTRMIRQVVFSSEEAERWRTLPGVSWVLAYTILAEVGTEVTPFPTSARPSTRGGYLPLI